MSRYDYTVSRSLTGAPFYALIMAAMREADSANAAKLQAAFPEVWDELAARYHAPGGYLDGEAVMGDE